MPRASRPGEFALIEQYFRPLAPGAAALGLGDDAALLRPRSGEDLVLTTDTVAAGVHFFADDPAESIARKALRVNLSDLAAKGAEPVGYLMALALPADWTEPWMRRFCGALADDQRTYGIGLLGGDTIRAAGGLTITITAVGSVPRGAMVKRAGARPGDAIFVSGTIGDSTLGLRVRRADIAAKGAGARFVLDRYLHPQPRTTLASTLRRYASAAMDVSDGLVGDLAHICDVSGVGAEIRGDRVPLSDAGCKLVAAGKVGLGELLNGGEDFEILATVPPANTARFAGAAKRAGVVVTEIGVVTAGSGPPKVRDSRGQTIAVGASHAHF